jgi:hypothetical protein
MNKNLFMSHLIALSCIHLSVVSMDAPRTYPQLQLQEPKKQIIIPVTGQVKIFDELNIAATFLPKSDQRLKEVFPQKRIFRVFLKNQRISLNEPWIHIELSFVHENTTIQMPLFIPSQCVFNLNDKSTIQFDLKQPQSNHIWHVTAICLKNPRISNKNFSEQFENSMRSFYAQIARTCMSKDDIQKLINTNVLIAQKEIWQSPVLSIVFNYTKYLHGPKGFPDEKRFIDFMAVKKTTPYGKSMHRFVTERQTGRPHRRIDTKINLDWILDDCLEKMESDNKL